MSFEGIAYQKALDLLYDVWMQFSITTTVKGKPVRTSGALSVLDEVADLLQEERIIALDSNGNQVLCLRCQGAGVLWAPIPERERVAGDPRVNRARKCPACQGTRDKLLGRKR